MKYLTYMLAIAITVLLLSCTDSPTLSNPEPCAEYELISIESGVASFERDVVIDIETDQIDEDITLEVGEAYIICSDGGPTYVESKS